MLRPPEALPQLTKLRFAVFRALWLALLAFAIFASIAGVHFGNVYFREQTAPYLELGLSPFPREPTKVGPPLGDEARRSNIVNNSELISIGGHAVRPGMRRQEIAALLRSAGREEVRIRTRTQDGSMREHLLRRSPDHAAQDYARTGMSLEQRRSLEIALRLLTDAIAIFTAILLFRRRPRDPVAALLSWGFLCLVINRESAGYTMAALGVEGLGGALVTTGFVALFAGLAAFPKGRFEPRWSGWVVLLLFVWAGAHLVSQWLMPFVSGTAQTLGWTALMCASLAAMAARFRRLPAGMERQQIKWALLGFAVGIVLYSIGWALSYVVPRIDDSVQRLWATLVMAVLRPLSLGCYAVGVLIALLRYRLYDADAVISRSAGYAVLTLLLGATFAATSKAMEASFESLFGGDAGALPGAVAAALAVVLITPLNNRIQGWAERRFQKALIHLRRDLPLCVGDLRETASMEQLLGTTLARVGAAVQASHCAMLLRQDDGWRVAAVRDVNEAAVAAWMKDWTPAAAAQRLDCDRRDPAFPMRVALTIDSGEAAEDIGWILLGPRPDGSFYGKDEQEALAEIADPVARAVAIVLAREQRQTENHVWRQRVEERFAAMESTLAELAPLSFGKLNPKSSAKSGGTA